MLRHEAFQLPKLRMFFKKKYPKPSAKFYIEGLHANYPDTNFMEMDDVIFVTQNRKGLDYEKGDKYG